MYPKAIITINIILATCSNLFLVGTCFQTASITRSSSASSGSARSNRSYQQTRRYMGIFDAFNKAFSNEKYASPPEGIKATARHILVKSLEQVDVVMNELKEGVDFKTVARRYSQCPSSSQGGSLGSFGPGTMVAEFDKVIFSSSPDGTPAAPIGQVVGPVQTQFGYHIIVVDKRTGV